MSPASPAKITPMVLSSADESKLLLLPSKFLQKCKPVTVIAGKRKKNKHFIFKLNLKMWEVKELLQKKQKYFSQYKTKIRNV